MTKKKSQVVQTKAIALNLDEADLVLDALRDYAEEMNNSIRTYDIFCDDNLSYEERKNSKVYLAKQAAAATKLADNLEAKWYPGVVNKRKKIAELEAQLAKLKNE